MDIEQRDAERIQREKRLMGCQHEEGCLELSANNVHNLCPKHFVMRFPIIRRR